MDFEIARQSKILNEGGTIAQETRRYDDAKRETILMRVKTDAVDYKYFPEPNITPIALSDEFVEDAIKNCPELADSKKVRYMNEYGLNEYDASQLLIDKDLSNYYDELTKYSKQYKLLANWVNVDINGYLNKNNINVLNFSLKPQELASLVEMVAKNTISSNQAKEIFNKMISDNLTALEAKKALGISEQISDNEFIIKVINEVLDEFPNSIVDYKEGKGRALGFMIGQVMKKTQGKVNPKLTNDLLLEELKKR